MSDWIPSVECLLHVHETDINGSANANTIQPAIERVQALADISRSTLYAFAVYKAILPTKPVHLLQIRPIVHK